jgi:type IV pilus assembly protein PilA
MLKTQQKRSTESGFTLIELLIVMSIILILATLAIPAMQNSIKKANQTSAIASLKDIAAQENNYNSDYPTHGFACSLAALGGKPGTGAPSSDAAQLIPEELAAGNKSGYTFAITNCNKITVNNQDQITGYTVTAVPNSVGHSGDRGYCTDENGQIHYDPKGGTNCTELLQ